MGSGMMNFKTHDFGRHISVKNVRTRNIKSPSRRMKTSHNATSDAGLHKVVMKESMHHARPWHRPFLVIGAANVDRVCLPFPLAFYSTFLSLRHPFCITRACYKWTLVCRVQLLSWVTGLPHCNAARFTKTLAKKIETARKPNIGTCMLERSRACATCARLPQFFWPG